MDYREAFFDELEKIASPPTLTMIEALKRLHPRFSITGMGKRVRELPAEEVKKIYRKFAQATTELPIPLSERLKSYKQWKKTKSLPEMYAEAGEAGWRPGSFGGIMEEETVPHEISSKLITLYSGGSKSSLEKIRKSQVGKSALEGPFPLLPGQLSLSSKGLYATSDKGLARTYAKAHPNRPTKEPGALLKFDIPRKYVVLGGGKAQIPDMLHARNLEILDV